MSHSKSEITAERGGQGGARTALREALSAAVDGEASELQLRRVVNALGTDAALRAEWERAHTIGATIGGVRASKPLPAERRPWLQDSADRSTAVLARWTRWAWPAAGAAAAAAAALAVVFAFTPRSQLAAPAPEVANAPANTAGAHGYRHLARVPSDVDLRRANTYMLRHVHQTSMSRTGAAPMPVGTVPFVKVLAVRDGRGHRANAEPGVGDRADR